MSFEELFFGLASLTLKIQTDQLLAAYLQPSLVIVCPQISRTNLSEFLQRSCNKMLALVLWHNEHDECGMMSSVAVLSVLSRLLNTHTHSLMKATIHE